MLDFIKKTTLSAFAITSTVFTFTPESLFEVIDWIAPALIVNCDVISNKADEINIIISRVVLFLLIWFACALLYGIFLKIKWFRRIKGNNYDIYVEYGNLLKKKKCKRVINFDECYTTTVGNRPEDINPTSLCGQYLLMYPDLDINTLLSNSGVKKATTKSKFQKKDRYEPGTVVVNGDDLLLAFAKLDDRGKGYLTRDEYLKCLDKLWREIELHYGQKDVCISVLGSGTTTMDGGSGASIPQQELLDMIIWSYKLSSHKIKSPNKLRIICKRNKDFSINSIEA